MPDTSSTPTGVKRVLSEDELAAMRVRSRVHYLKNKDKAKARTYKNRTQEKSMLYAARLRAKKRGWDCNIDVSDIVIPATCPVLGIPIERGQSRLSKTSPTLDRVDTTKGYVKGNVRVISNKANMCKSDMTPEQIRSLYWYVFGLEQV